MPGPRVESTNGARAAGAVEPLRLVAGPAESAGAGAAPELRVVGVPMPSEPTATPRPRLGLVSGAVEAPAPEAAAARRVQAASVATEVEATETATETAVAEEEVAATPEATEEPTEEPVAEATPAATEEVPEEAVVEATPVAAEEATAGAAVTGTVPLTETAPVSPTAETPAGATKGGLVDVVDTAAAMGDLTTFVAAVEAAGLSDILKSEGPYTIFAPTDEAFASLPAGRLDELMSNPGGDLLDILLYHVLPGRVTTAEVTDGQQLETIQGATVTFTVGKGGVLINATNIITPDIEATNGVLHVIGRVLSAPVGEGAEVAPGEEVTDTGVMTATGIMTSAEPSAAAGEVTGTGVLTASGMITSTEPLTGSVPVTDSEAVSDTASSNATETAAVEAAVVVSPPARRPIAPIAMPADVWSAPEGTLEVVAPVSGGAYHSPIDVTGLAQTFMGNVAVSLVAEDGTVLAERATVGGAAGAYALFHTYLRFMVPEPTTATLQVTDMDMGEGTVMAQVSVPVTLLPGQRAVDVTYPAVGDAVCGALTASGYSSTFKASAEIELLARSGELLEQAATMGGTLGVYHDFAAPLAHTASAAGPEALLLVASESDASGRYPHIDRTVVPFTLYPDGSDACEPK